jgi:hypothetical protein
MVLSSGSSLGVLLLFCQFTKRRLAERECVMVDKDFADWMVLLAAVFAAGFLLGMFVCARGV